MKLVYLWMTLMVFLASCSLEDSFDQQDIKAGSLARFIVKEGYMYSLNHHEVLTFALQPDGAPLLKSKLALDYGLETIIAYEDLLYVGSRIGLYILDISKPDQPVLLSKTERAVSLIGGCDPVVVRDSFAYSTVKIINDVCGQRNTRSVLLVYQIEDPTSPVEVGEYELDEPNGLGYKDDILFVCDEGTDRVILIDIADPHTLVFTDIEVVIQDPIDLIIHGSRMVVATRTDFQFYDIQDIHDIRPLGVISK
ncbi:MAG: hypothetical protein K9I85_14290 [Saprospiraceae bacterium]|nr:hypothetical protein [Saprospiraceae bacterium]